VPVEIRPLGGFEEVERAVAIHNLVTPHDPTSVEMHGLLRASELERVDLVASLDDEVVGVGWLAGDPNSLESTHPFVSVAVDPAYRGRGVGTALLRELSQCVQRLGRSGLHCEVRADDPYSLGFLERRGFVEFDRSEQVRFDADERPFPTGPCPDGIELAWLTDRPDLMPELHTIAVETHPETRVTPVWRAGTQHRWMLYSLGDPAVLLALTPIALADGRPIGFSTIWRVDDETAIIRMTAVLPGWRRRGVARCLLSVQVEAAAVAGYHTLLAEHRDSAIGRSLRRLGFGPHTTILDVRGPFQPAGAT
jgi:ribosomal protein S18 acetylase RimI-like enzyme